MPDHAADRGARHGMMTRHMAHDTAHRGALQATLRAAEMRKERHRYRNYQT
jgi:hypothetical protein